ncbi:hypothetical protein EAI89_14090 [Eubacterium sp. am_0171]|uniref:Methylcobalamin:coenzyme M methyltransferase n=1 Tax=Faecalicatena contorta TaxID=39482 RepID=A0A174BC19_9FIRM|nr:MULTISPECIES: uroporphyrinogen decarboxylase family protein [Clostridia]MSC84991.1 hypothetical protein [Eubacterium sp. BIOML-A1]MSD07318.1 hypothetical protein [Eubacterium sp. BIOML-A2]RYT15624.1 hypothetical protein EAI89_14090 [Eubacterium sp. am_0171]CUN98174.1 methylcobalamin:coenzyme M methyltransferase [[Eubacterium] contortum] [Faecalicatena contorta]
MTTKIIETKETMTPKQRLLAALRGEKTDRTPWCPNLAYWYDFNPEEARGKSMMQVMQEMGADPLIRGFDPTKIEYEHLRMYQTVYQGCSIEDVYDKEKRTMTIRTPIGCLTARYIITPDGETWFLSEHPIKEEEDFKIARYFFDHMELIPDYTAYNKAAAEVGEEALIVPMLMPEINLKSAFQSLLEFWLGTEELVYALMDYPEEVEALLESIRRVDRIAVEISAGSDAEVFLTWEDTSTTNISPSYYEKYILPELNEWSEILESRQKMYMQHACGHLQALLGLIAGSKVHGIESISPAPTGNIVMKEARRVLPKEKFLVGGIEPTEFLNWSLSELEVYVKELLKDMEGYPFILANSDSCPPGVEYEKFLMISKVVRNQI